MESLDNTNYPVLKLNKGVLLNTFTEYGVQKYLLIVNIFFIFWGIFVDESSLIKFHVQIKLPFPFSLMNELNLSTKFQFIPLA